jgi:glycosyltransferase involved in cell wall biosynthesis
VHTVWQLARRHRAADAVVGLAPALATLAKRAADPRLARRGLLRRGPHPAVAADSVRERVNRLAETVARRGSGRRVLSDPRGRRAWRALLRVPGLSDTKRLLWGKRVVEKLVTMDRPADASALRAAAAHRIREPVARAEWLGTAATDELAAGRVPEFLSEAAAAELVRADQALARDNIVEATQSVARIIPFLFHRAVHFDSLESPMARDPQGFLAPLHDSLAGRTLAAPRGRRTPAAPPPTDRPQRLLFVTRANEYFLGDIRERYREHPDFEVRHFDLRSDPEQAALSGQADKLIRHLLAGESEYGNAIREWFAPQLEWADTVFVDWCLGHAAMLATLDPGSTRVIVRLHSYEAFTVFPHLLDLSRVDDLVFVSEPLRDFTTEVVPRLRAAGAPRTPVVTNAVRLDRYRRPKTPDARFTLGLVGLNAIAKDPRWAFEVLRELRRRDDRYRLVLIGKEIDGTPTPQAKAYHQGYAKDLAALEAEGSVRRVGQTDDVPAALADVGVILSSSVRESFHLGLIEGAASGAVPVVRDWPFFAGREHSARSIFPADWIVETPAQAADRIIAHTNSDEIWRKTGEAAAEHALITWDWSVTQAEYDRLLRPL